MSMPKTTPLLVLMLVGCSETVGETVDRLRPDLERIHARIVSASKSLPAPGAAPPLPLDVTDISYNDYPLKLLNTTVADPEFLGEKPGLELRFLSDTFQRCWRALQAPADARERASTHAASREACEVAARLRYALLVRVIELRPARLVEVPGDPTASPGTVAAAAETRYLPGHAALEWVLIDLERPPDTAVRGRFITRADTPKKVEYIDDKDRPMTADGVVAEIHEELVRAHKLQATEVLRPHARRLSLGHGAPLVQ